MFTYKIEKKKGFIEHIKHGVYQLTHIKKQDDIPAQVAKAMQQNPHLPGYDPKQQPMETTVLGDEPDTIPVNDRMRASVYMDKNNYNQWVNSLNIQWPKGTMVTMRQYPVIPGRETVVPWYTVDSIQEMRHLAPWDTTYKQPRSVCLKSGDKEGVYTLVCPMAIRKLTDAEKFLVHLHDQKEQVREAEQEEQFPDVPH